LRKKRVLILSEGFGTGHTQAAKALAVNIRRTYPGVQTRVFELGSFLNPTISRWVLQAYRQTVSHQPKLVGMIYKYKYEKSLGKLTQLALHRLFYTQTAAMLKQLAPDVIICTHPFPNIVISRLKRLGMRIPLCTVITDYDAHATWISDEVDRYLVSGDVVKNKLLSKGVRASHIHVTGMPIHPEFWQAQNRAEIREKMNLKEMPTVLVMGGGWGLLDNEELYRHLMTWRTRVQFIFCLGQNEKARRQMQADALFCHENVHLLGYTKQISQLMEVADLLITKPGGMTCSEAYAKRLPMLFLEPLPGQEQENCHYFSALGIGREIESTATFDEVAASLLANFAHISQERQQVLTQLRQQQQHQFGAALSNFL
jgi:processive 1,2-diacylglycerol beta-glucosyltransferase